MIDSVHEVADFVHVLPEHALVWILRERLFLTEALGMSDDAKKAARDRFLIDAREVAPFVLDVEPGAMRGLKRAQPGFSHVLHEIMAAQARFGEQAGVLSRDLEELKLLTERIETIRKILPDIRKLLELLVETELVMDDRRQQIVRVIARTIDNAFTLTKNGELLGVYEKTRSYRSAAAKKGVKTRQKRAALRAERQAETAEPKEGRA